MKIIMVELMEIKRLIKNKEDKASVLSSLFFII